MTRVARRTAVRLAIVAAVAAAALLPILAASRGGDPAPREVTVVAREMAFFVDGQATPNPALTFRAGERVRLVLRNEDAGIIHDFVIRSWRVATKTLADKGARDVVEFRVPKERGTYEYQCTPHSAMMRGRITVE
jgi:plastocyanin